jgi:hypothetical protein
MSALLNLGDKITAGNRADATFFYKKRVADDSGTLLTEAETDANNRELLAQKLFDKASIVYTAGGVKASKAYSVKGTDFTVTRAGVKNVIGRDGVLTEVASNVPATEFANGVLKGTLIEPARTNLAWVTETPATGSRTVTAVVHTLSFYGTGEVVLSGAGTGTLTGAGTNNERVSLTFTATAGTLTLTVTGSPVKWQLETGSVATSYINNTGAEGTSATQPADVITATGVSGDIGQTSGGFVAVEVERRSNTAPNRRLVFIGDGSNNNNNRIDLTGAGTGLSNQLSFVITTDGTNVFFYTTPGDQLGKIKALFYYSATERKVFINGVKVNEALTTVAIPTLSAIGLGQVDNQSKPLASGFFLNDPISQVLIGKTAISDAEAIAWTTI